MKCVGRLAAALATAIGAMVIWAGVTGLAMVMPPVTAAVWLVAALGGSLWLGIRGGSPRAQRRRRALIRLRRPGPSLVHASGIALAFFFFQIAAACLIVGAGFGGGVIENEAVAAYAARPLGWLPLWLLACACAPVVEEVIFRGMLQHRLERLLGAWPGILISAGVFAGMHDGRGGGVLPFVFGVVAGHLAHVTGSIWVPIALHAENNALGELAGWVLPERLASPESILGLAGYGPIFIMLLASGALVVWALVRVPPRRRAGAVESDGIAGRRSLV